MFTLRYTEYSYRKHVYDRASEFLIPLLRKHSRVPRGILVWKVAGLNNEGLIDMLVAAFQTKRSDEVLLPLEPKSAEEINIGQDSRELPLLWLKRLLLAPHTIGVGVFRPSFGLAAPVV